MNKTVLAILFGLLSFGVAAGERIDFIHKEWATAVANVDDKTVFRAFTVMGDDGVVMALFMDKEAEDCGTSHLSLELTVFSPSLNASPGSVSSAIAGKLRVDKNKIRTFKFTTTSISEYKANFNVVSWDDGSSGLYEELYNGDTLRFKLYGPAGGKDLYVKFPLAGSAAALLKADELCKQYNPDEKYFNKSIPAVNPEEEWFY